MSKIKRQSDYIVSTVEKEVCKISRDFTLKSISSTSRKPNASHARFMIWYILYKRYHMNFTYIGKIYNKHYTSIEYGIRRAIDLDLVKNIPRKLLEVKMYSNASSTKSWKTHFKVHPWKDVKK